MRSELVLGFGNWEAVGDLRGSSCKSGTGEAIPLGLGRLLAAKEGRSRPGWGRGSMRVIWTFAVDADFPLLQGSSSGTEGTTVFGGGGRARNKGEGRRADGRGEVSGGKDGVWSVEEQGFPQGSPIHPLP